MKKVFVSIETKQEDLFLDSKEVYYAVYVSNQNTQGSVSYVNIVVKCIQKEKIDEITAENVINQDVPGIIVKSYNENFNLDLETISVPEDLPTTNVAELQCFLEDYYLKHFLDNNTIYNINNGWVEL